MARVSITSKLKCMPPENEGKSGLGAWAPVAAQGAIAIAQGITRGGPRRQYKWNKRAANDANIMNRENAIWALEENKRIQQEQRVYDSPANQMARYKAAGLNPHLIYGNGSGSSGGAFPISAPSIAPSRIDAPSAAYPDIAGSFLQAGQTLAQTALSESKAVESGFKSEVLELQAKIAATNPMLDPEVYQKTIRVLEMAARQKIAEHGYLYDITKDVSKDGKEMIPALRKIQNDLDKESQQLGLNTADQKIKNKILESKEFENMLKEIQVRWLKDADVTPQHIYQGIMMLLMKML